MVAHVRRRGTRRLGRNVIMALGWAVLSELILLLSVAALGSDAGGGLSPLALEQEVRVSCFCFFWYILSSAARVFLCWCAVPMVFVERFGVGRSGASPAPNALQTRQQRYIAPNAHDPSTARSCFAVVSGCQQQMATKPSKPFSFSRPVEFRRRRLVLHLAEQIFRRR